MAANLQQWRKRNNLTQLDAAALLGVPQAYLSLLETGERPMTVELSGRLKVAKANPNGISADDRYARQLSVLGYPGFAHIPPAKNKSRPDVFLLSVLSQPDVDARVAEGLPWLVREYSAQWNLKWLVRQAKLRNLQNRLGFVLQIADVQTPEISAAIQELESARLPAETTYCWDTMPMPVRDWMRVNRTPLAEHWNVLTRVRREHLSHVFRVSCRALVLIHF